MKQRIAADILIAGLVLGLAAVMFAINRMHDADGGFVVVYVRGEEYARVPLGETRTLTIEQLDGSVNIVEVFEDGARMAFSTCKNQLCVKQGDVHAESAHAIDFGHCIVCLPNAVSVEIVPGGGR